MEAVILSKDRDFDAELREYISKADIADLQDDDVLKLPLRVYYGFLRQIVRQAYDKGSMSRRRPVGKVCVWCGKTGAADNGYHLGCWTVKQRNDHEKGL